MGKDRTTEEKRKKRIEELEERVAALEKERSDYLNGWKRARADLVNFKKETAESFSRFADVAKVETVRELLLVHDALCEADKHAIEGLRPVKTLFEQVLTREGVEMIVPESGSAFDPLSSEAVDGTGDIVDTVRQCGFIYKDHIIRPAKVTVRDQ